MNKQQTNAFKACIGKACDRVKAKLAVAQQAKPKVFAQYPQLKNIGGKK